MDVQTKVEWNSGARQELKEMPDRVVYTIARITLDTTYQHIPLSRNKKKTIKPIIAITKRRPTTRPLSL